MSTGWCRYGNPGSTICWLSDYLDLSSYNGRKSLPEYGLGRNCTLFEKTRLWAYKAIRQGWPDYPEWLAACVDRASGYNAQFEQPLPANEVRHTAKSIAKWTHQHLSPAGFRRSRPGEVRRAARYQGRGRPSNSGKDRQLRLSVHRPLFFGGVGGSSYPRAALSLDLALGLAVSRPWLNNVLSKATQRPLYLLRGLGPLWPCSGVLRPPKPPVAPARSAPSGRSARWLLGSGEWTRPYVNNTDRERFEKEGSQWRYF